MMILRNNKVLGFFRKILDNLIFDNFFIALCAVGMVFSTFLINNVPVNFTPFTYLVMFGTFLIYNFHRQSFQLNFSGMKSLVASISKLRISFVVIFFSAIALFFCIYFFILLSSKIRFLLLLMALISLAYSVPFIRWKHQRFKLREVFFIKTPLIAVVWGIVTAWFPVLEQNIDLPVSLLCMQVLCRSLFIFALCIPFEIRDYQEDKKRGIVTLVVKHGIKISQQIGIVIIIFEIILHHMISLSLLTAISLDISSLIALIWILKKDVLFGKYFYKGIVDGTMLIRFILLFAALKFK